MTEISIIVPVLHEESTIQNLIQRLEFFTTQQTALEVILVDGDRNGSTLHSVRTAYSWITGITASPGRGTQMNAGAKLARGRILLFLHADVNLPDTAITDIEIALRDPLVQGGAFDFRIQSQDKRQTYLLWWIALIATWRSRLTRIPYGDQAIFLRRQVFEEIGGYPNIPILEDVALMTTLKKRRARIQILHNEVIISDRRWRKEGILWTTLRNWIVFSLYRLGISPHLLVRWYPPPQKSLTTNTTDVC